MRTVTNDELVELQDSLSLNDELSCAACLRPLNRAVAPSTCGHLMCEVRGVDRSSLLTCSRAASF